ncbi:uncharacterized protein BKCO1_1100088 [Diplodia corticola]|uniref:Uncharacterized protein n=1 Tax=Diplodia corticola TaxID=236234 RepID=A0A1J9R7N2_9PEZI|nr:uncharacterized protein BKCO1_1100088 [Diplodia corticola]OJD36529.1 hypothetical protein BKCO1_1100088 [Diplodia corticola]
MPHANRYATKEDSVRYIGWRRQGMVNYSFGLDDNGVLFDSPRLAQHVDLKTGKKLGEAFRAWGTDYNGNKKHNDFHRPGRFSTTYSSDSFFELEDCKR